MHRLTTLFSLAILVTHAAHAAPREVRVGVYENPPKLLAGPSGHPSGILGDILQELARLEAWTLVPVPCEWDGCLRLLEDGQIDLMPDVAYNEARAQLFDFHRVPALASWSQVYRRPEVELQSVLDLEGKRVVVVTGSVQQRHLADLIESFGLHVELILVGSFEEAFTVVGAGKADAVAANHFSGETAAGRHGLLATSLVFLPSKLYFAVDKGRNGDLLEAIDGRLAAWQAQAGSVYFDALKRWGPQASGPQAVTIFWSSLALAAGLLALVLLVLLARELARKTSALRVSEQRFRDLAEHSADWIWSLDLHGRHTYCSPSTVAILGYSNEELLELDPHTLVHPDDLALFDSTMGAARNHVSGWRNVVIRWRARDGAYKMLESNAVPVIDVQGNLQGFQGVDRDITERVAAEQERQRLALILEATNDIVGMLDPSGNLIYLNRAGCTLLGISPQKDLPKVVSHVHPKWAADIVLSEGLQTAVQKGRWSGETAVIGPEGEVPVSQIILSHKDQQNHLLFLSTVMRDIRESRVAAKALSESEERLRLAMMSANQGLYDLDLTTGNVKVSAEYATMLGYDPATFQESIATWKERMHPDDKSVAYQAYEDYVSGRQPVFRVEFRQRTRDGGWKWILSLGSVQERDSDGHPCRMLGTHTDIDSIKTTEAAMRELNESLEHRVYERTAELTAANQELETFAYAVSHDLRAPVRAMIGFSSAILEDHAASMPVEAKVFLEQIVMAGRKMGALVEGLLTLSRSAHGDMRLDQIDVSALAKSHLAQLSEMDRTRRVLVEVEPGIMVTGDERMITSVLTNLLDNAWKYTSATAQPRIRVCACEVSGQAGFSISDNGAGFDMAHAARLFQPFQRLHRQDEFPGIGIGLATVQRIVQRHGGHISAHGVPGEGATFSVVFPVKNGHRDGASTT